MEPGSLNSGNTVKALTQIHTQKKVTDAQFKHLSCKTVGDCKPMVKKSEFIGNTENFEQFYFSGLVYRYDSRNISELKQAGGFLPRNQRSPNNPLHISNITSIAFASNCLFGAFKVCSNPVADTLVATSKKIDYSNGEWSFSQTVKQHKYMIDTKFKNIYGLDADSTMENNGQTFYFSNEVCFENPLPFETIVGWFKGDNYSEFYENDEYQGHFKWSNTESLTVQELEKGQEHGHCCAIL